MNVRPALDRARHYSRRPLARMPFLWDVAMWLRPAKRATLARRDTAVVIEGFLRSGNTFSVAAFAVSNGEGHVGRHLHGAAHVLRAARLGLPTVVLIRRPEDAVLSYVIRRGSLTPYDALVEYLDFYSAVWRIRESFVIGMFDQVVSDFGVVIDELNAMFGTSFARYEPTPANEARAFALVEEMNRLECGGAVVETHVGRPSGERTRRKAESAGALRTPRTAAKLAAAEHLYRQYEQLAADRARRLRAGSAG